MIVYFLVAFLSAQPRLDYTVEIEEKALSKMISYISKEEYAKAEHYLNDFEAKLFPSSRLHYELGLQYNTLGKLTSALQHYNQALKIDPHLQPALYDRAEIFLLQKRTKEAQQDLEQLVSENVEHWVIYFRLAEIYAQQQQGSLFEEHILLAIRYGFSLHLLLESGDNWKTYANDPILKEHLYRIIQLYGDESIWESLQQ